MFLFNAVTDKRKKTLSKKVVSTDRAERKVACCDVTCHMNLTPPHKIMCLYAQESDWPISNNECHLTTKNLEKLKGILSY